MESWCLPFLLLVIYHQWTTVATAQGASVPSFDTHHGYYMPRPDLYARLQSPSPTGIAKRAWKNPFATIMGNRPVADRLDSDTRAPINVQDSQLLPDALIHQQFLKPQLEAQGFSGGHIVAGPFPVPLSQLPKAPPQQQQQQQLVRSPTPYYRNQQQQQPQQSPQPIYTLQQQQKQQSQASAPQPTILQPYHNNNVVKSSQPQPPLTPLQRPGANVYASQPAQFLYKGSVAPAPQPSKFPQQYYNPIAESSSHNDNNVAPAIRWTYGQWTPIYQGAAAPVPKYNTDLSDADLQNLDFGNIFNGLGNAAASAFAGNFNSLDANLGGKVPYRRSVEPAKKHPDSIVKKPVYVKPSISQVPDLEGGESQIITADSAGIPTSKVSRLGQGSGRYVGRVLPAYVRSDVAAQQPQKPAAAVSVNHDSTLSLSSVGYTLRFAPERR